MLCNVMYACMYACMHACMDACMYVCIMLCNVMEWNGMYVCISIHKLHKDMVASVQLEFRCIVAVWEPVFISQVTQR